ncbi:hypothetical protein NLU13_4568 [Sarocladium strictum]|uniref:Uncharacterized protein n=1 Tax=Sarocladium strictum TaxID=5046 RepID=A0AA39L8T2_SARSR|nr:hypothetical protein NLU13_4568 [Sarocladium strictum]
MAPFQLALELSNLFPARELSRSAFSAVMSLARDLRKSGSDLVIETDLAQIFGRARIDHDFEARFRGDVLLTTPDKSVAQIYPGSGIHLQAGPGPTVRHACKSPEKAYLASVIQLSMLAWFHQRTELASALTECIAKRFQLKYPDSNPDPGYHGIEATLEAVSSQTSTFAWSDLAEQVERKLRAAHPSYGCRSVEHRNLTALSPNQLLAAMDMLCTVQRLPEDRLMEVKNQKGIVVLILWANHLLSLTVRVQGLATGELVFPGSYKEVPQVIIHWDNHLDPYNPDEAGVYLLDSSMEVLLSIEPGILSMNKVAGEERHSVLDYGTKWLRRTCNFIISVSESDPLYQDLAEYVTAMAWYVSQGLCRTWYIPRQKDDTDDMPIVLDRWQVAASARLLFRGIGVNLQSIDSMIEKATPGCPLKDFPRPRSLEGYLGRVPLQNRAEALMRLDLRSLTVLVVLIASVVGVDSDVFAHAPISFSLSSLTTQHLVESLWNESAGKHVRVEELEWVGLLGQLLVGRGYQPDAHDAEMPAFIISDFGWSLVLDTVADKDPGDVRPWMMHLRQGVPTNSQTSERKHRVCDFYNIDDALLPDRTVHDRTAAFLPRTVTAVTSRTEYVTSRRDAFLVSVRLRARELQGDGAVKVTDFNYHQHTKEVVLNNLALSPRELNQALWVVHFSEACEHGTSKPSSALVRLGTESVTTNSLNWRNEGCVVEDSSEMPQRVCVLLVKDDPRARWLAVREAVLNPHRKVLLRCKHTCVDCAIDRAAGTRGRWLVII